MSTTQTNQTTEMTTGSVTSKDGTRIGYLRTGTGPAVVLLHGSMQSASSHTQLALALADEFTVYLPDRRGHGTSGPWGPDYGIRTEVEDLEAMLAESGARLVFGVSSSGLIALEAARALPGIDKVVVYEPALLMGDSTRYTQWLTQFDEEMAEGKVAAALITSMHGLGLAPAAFRVMPRRLLEGLTNMAMKSEDKKAAEGAPTMRSLAPTLHCEGTLVAEMAGSIDTFRDISAEVLLLGGSKGLPYLKPALTALEQTLPHSQRVELPGLDHGGPGDPSNTNRAGQPEVVAREVRRFFAQS